MDIPRQNILFFILAILAFEIFLELRSIFILQRACELHGRVLLFFNLNLRNAFSIEIGSLTYSHSFLHRISKEAGKPITVSRVLVFWIQVQVIGLKLVDNGSEVF